ncbi:lipopolysaccharide biosynthesis protein [Streptomyces sp. NBRC 109706]|uniref:lipopolysaccharide biosynthesis protein n=1 Tax=Streptomyces sp. NBRC 109706 TaxID=1550035 RepID=UPI000782F345|nr:lipopolysaccharide biosynthesis protein [Streptomyces sp. NBRC 109706]
MSAVGGQEPRAGAPHQPHDEPDLLRDQFRQLLRYRTLIICGILIGLAGGAWLGLAANESYVATSEVTVRTPTADPFAAAAMDRVAMGSERRTAVSDIVAERAALALNTSESLGRLKRGLQVTNPPNTEVLRFAYTASDPEVAAQRANAFVAAYLANRQADAEDTIARNVASLEGQREPLLERRDQLQAELETLVEGGSAYDLAVADLSQVVGRISELNSDISAARALDTSGGRVITEATPPGSPAGPGLPLLLGLGYVVGIGLGLLAAWVRLVFDPTVRSAGDVTRALRAPVLGVLPRAGRGDPEQLLAEGRLAEEYRSIAFRLAYDETFAGRRRLLVLAPRGGIETPLAAAVNITAAFAEMGMDALLVEADLRTPTLINQLRHADGVRPGWARTPARLDGGGWPAGLRVPIDAGESGIFDLVPGRRVRNVPRALTSRAATDLIKHADAKGSVVVVLAPPVLSYADAIALTDRVDGVLVVCDPSEVRREDLARVRELVVGAGGLLLGAVLHSWGNGSENPRGQAASPDLPPPAPQPRSGGPTGSPRATGPDHHRDPNSETMGLRVLDPADLEDGSSR